MLTQLVPLLRGYEVTYGEESRGMEHFLRFVVEFFPYHSLEYKLIARALYEAYETLERSPKKTREDGQAHISHPIAVAVILLVVFGVRNHEVIIAALLHDCVEDFPDEWNYDRIEDGYGNGVAILVYFVTKPSLLNYGMNTELRDAAYHALLLSGSIYSILIKLADRLHNLITIWPTSKEKRFRKVSETRSFYILILGAQFTKLCQERAPTLLSQASNLIELLEEGCVFATCVQVDSD